MVILAEYMTWPKISIWVVISFFTFFVIWYIGWSLLKGRYQKHIRQEVHWHILLSHLNKHNLISKEIKFIKEFFESLDNDGKILIFDSRKHFREMLKEYIHDHEELESEQTVSIFQKIFSNKDHDRDVESLKDLYAGETTALELGNTHYLASIIKIYQNEVVLHIENFKPELYNVQDTAHMYVYRMKSGGYLLEGAVKEFTPESCVFHYLGHLQQKGQQHLMCNMEATIIAIPWPIVPRKVSANRIDGKTVKISDRAISFHAKYPEEMDYKTRRNDLWTIQVQLKEGYKFTCRGTIAESTEEKEVYICHFLDIPETARKILFVEISERNPVREKLL